MVRLFIAIPIPDWIGERLLAVEEPLRGFRWVEKEHLHLTLKYIGDVGEEMIESVTEKLEGIDNRDFIIDSGSLDTFSTRRGPSVIHARIERPHPHLIQLQKKVEDLCFSLGIEPEKRAYQPHITLCRCGDAHPETVRQFLKRHDSFALPPFQAESFQLLRSDPTPSGSLYTPLRTWQLRPVLD